MTQLSVVRSNYIERQRKTQKQAQQQPCSERHATLTNSLPRHVCSFIHSFLLSFSPTQKVNEFVLEWRYWIGSYWNEDIELVIEDYDFIQKWGNCTVIYTYTTTIFITKEWPPVSKKYALTPIIQVWPMLISYGDPQSLIKGLPSLSWKSRRL